MVKRLLICKSWRLRQIDPQETYKLQYLYFLPLNILPFLFFNEYFREGKWSALAFYARGRGEKHPFINMHEQNVIGSQTQLNDIAYRHTIISRQLFAGLMDSRPMKRKKNLHRMINNFRVFFSNMRAYHHPIWWNMIDCYFALSMCIALLLDRS